MTYKMRSTNLQRLFSGTGREREPEGNWLTQIYQEKWMLNVFVDVVVVE